jgi:hypothetical protein
MNNNDFLRMRNWNIPVKDCVINNMFKDSNEPEWHKLEYCQDNCTFKCLRYEEYKKI